MLVNAANDVLTHYPEKPAGMSDELYEKGKQGAGRCNIAWNYNSLSLAMQNGWMDDSNASNIDRAGHRRWMLNPGMQYTGFGEVGKYTAMYSMDRSREGFFASDYVVWPAPQTPLDMFVGSLCTVSLGAKYDDPVANQITVTVSSQTLGRTWTLQKGDANFYVDTGSFGIDRCIIFKPAEFTQDDTLRIRINGITKNGVEAPIEYTANLFSVSTLEVDRTTIMTRPSWGADYNVNAASLLTSEAPQVRWRSADPNVCEIAYYNNRPVYYGKSEGRTTITVYTGGAYVDVDVIIKNSQFLLGDADDDGEISITDVTFLERHLSQIETPGICDYQCDVDSDDIVSVTDVALLKRWLAEIPIHYAVGTSQQSPFTL